MNNFQTDESNIDKPPRKLTRHAAGRTDIISMSKHCNKAAEERAYEKITKIKYITSVYFGQYLLKAWYFSPFPEDYGNKK